jgi:hypothetical protein
MGALPFIAHPEKGLFRAFRHHRIAKPTIAGDLAQQINRNDDDRPSAAQ